MRPVPAATLLPLRRGFGGLEVLMVRRADRGDFGGIHVFPGGKVDPVDRGELAGRAVIGCPHPQQGPWLAAALRETAEEAGLYVTDRPISKPPPGLTGAAVYRAVLAAGSHFEAGRLAYLSTWVTPDWAPRRWDTRFYAADVDGEATADGTEILEAGWVRPARALDRARLGEWKMILPTLAHLEFLAAFPDPGRVLAEASGTVGVPRLFGGGVR